MKHSKFNDEGEDRQVHMDDPQVPAGVREAASAPWQQGDSLWRCPRIKARKGLFNFHAQPVGIEWWLIDPQGNLVEAFWEI